MNAICPAGLDSERLDYLGRREDGSCGEAKRVERVKHLSAAVPLGRLSMPEDVAEVAAFLASDAAEYIAAQAINVSGGSIRH